jgi:rod shape-determining protein MreC
MRNLIAFFKRFQVFLMFALLQILALYIYFSFMSFPKTQVLTSTNVIVGNFFRYKNDFTKLLNLSRTNTKLQKENIKLRENSPFSLIKIDRNTIKIDDTLYHQQYEFIPAIVINSTFDKRNNFFTLNAGTLQGIKRGMGVFSDAGVVGVIHHASKHFSIVESVLTENINLDVMIEKSGAFGLLKWEGTHARFGKISGISNDIRVKKWSKVVTRGASGVFPYGIPVGKIYKIGSVEGKPLWDVTILFSEDYRKIQRVYVIKNILQEEQNQIESLIPEDKEEE